jgi:hypothetical protein
MGLLAWALYDARVDPDDARDARVVPSSLATLIRSATGYPPALALARTEIIAHSVPATSEFLDRYASIFENRRR